MMSRLSSLRNILILSLILNFVFSSVIIYGCFGQKKTESKKSQEQSDKEFLENTKKGILSRVDLLCTKHGIQSEELKQDLLKYIVKYDLGLSFLENENKLDDKYLNDSIYGIINVQQLRDISTKHGIAFHTLSGLYYDYMVLDELRETRSSCDK